MINKVLTVQVDLTTLTAPYTYAFSASDTCATFDPNTQSGTSSAQTISTTVYFDNLACMEDTVVNLQVVDASGCSQTIQLDIASLCADFTVNLVQLEDYKFQATATAPGCTGVSFQWFFHDGPFSVVSKNDTNFQSTLELTVDSNTLNLPATSAVTVYVQDCNGCPVTEVLNFEICKPHVADKVVHLHCKDSILGTIYISPTIDFNATTGCTSDIDWSTLSFNLPSGFGFTPINPTVSPVTKFVFQTNSSVTPGVYSTTWRVRDVHGVWSNTAALTLVVRSCNPLKTIVIPNQVIPIDCNTVTPGDTVEINIEDSVYTTPGTTVDWASWSLFATPVYVSPSIQLTTNIEGDHVIQYETTSPSISSDVFSFSVCDTEGNCADVTTYTIVECITAPVTVADADCVACNSSVEIDVLSNDSSSNMIDITSVEIDAAPSDGVVSVQATGTIIYTPNAGFEGVDTFDYTVADVFGERSAPATVTVTVVCAGEDTEVTICNA